MLAGIACFHKRALPIAAAGLLIIVAYEWLFSAFPTGSGAAALGAHLKHEWVTFANLLLLLVGFELLSNQFERSNLPDQIPRVLPDNWAGGLVLLTLVFVLSAFLDNIAGAVLGMVAARHVYGGRVSVGFVAAIVAAANAGGAGSVIGDTTTTLMWLHGISPLAVLPAFVGSVAALAVFGVAAALQQHAFQPIAAKAGGSHPLRWRRIAIVVIILTAAVGANVLANGLGVGEQFPWLGMAVCVAILITSPLAAPDWSLIKPGLRGATFLVLLVASASLMPVKALPNPSWQSVAGLGVLSSVFDNIPLTMLALSQGNYDWALLAYAVGLGGSMTWFGSSAGVAVSNIYPEARSIVRWVKQGWFVPVGFAVGFAVQLLLFGWVPA
jgi:Na+/H+ antiporter NhaD/arsenite permease-like protein